jgi:type II secretory pathway component PulC
MTMFPARMIVVMSLLVAASCQPRTRPLTSPFDIDDPSASGVAEPRRVRPVEARPAPVLEGTVDRNELVAVLDEGPGNFLSGVQVEPYFRDERFAGWEIISFWPAAPRYASVDLRRGDIITKVNGKEIKRPKQLSSLWSELRDAAAIEVDGLRDGAPFVLRFQVVGGPPTPLP